jgi:hypothetical protein
VRVESERLSRLDGDASSDAIAEAWAPSVWMRAARLNSPQ